MSLLDMSRHFEKPTLEGTQEGWVVDNNDPDKRQRVKIRLPLMHREIPDDKLPWSNISGGGSHANAGSGVGSVNVPDMGAKMTMRFEDDDPHNPKFESSPTSDDVNKDNELLNEDYPSTMGHIDSYGNKFLVNKATGDVTTVHKSGAVTHIDGAGNINFTSPGDVNISAQGNVTIVAGGELNAHGNGATNIVGSRIDLNSNGPNAATAAPSRSTPTIADRSGMDNF